jgi:hypothetical protein
MKAFLLICSLTLHTVYGQISVVEQCDTLNQVDSAGEKTGWWLTYLDANLVVLKDSIGATHCMYNYYLSDIFLHRYGKGLGSKKHPVHFPTDQSLKIGKYKLLNGDYITKYKNGNNHAILSASKGVLIYYKEYYPDGKLKHEFIYSEACGAPIRHCIREYGKDEVMKYDGHNWVPKKALETAEKNAPNSETNETQKGMLDGKTYQIVVRQVSKEKPVPSRSWPEDKFIFESGKMYSLYMQEHERFSPTNYQSSANSVATESTISFECVSANPSGSTLHIDGNVQGSTIRGAITWTSAANDLIRTYTYEGILI